MARMTDLDRRSWLMALGAFLSLASLPASARQVAEAEPFSWSLLKRRALALSRQPYRPRPPISGAVAIDYDAVGQIRYRDDATLWPDIGGVRMFPISRAGPVPVSLSIIENGRARPFDYHASLFEMPAGNPARALGDNAGFAGFRIMNKGGLGDWLAFLGASYFRSAGSENQYGLSARGIAVNTGTAQAEEFPVFTDFWLERAADGAIIVYALLDGPSVAGAYRFVNRLTEEGVVQDVDLSVRLRAPVERLGFAPMTSMFWYGEGNHHVGTDWRPEIHDSDGLAIATGKGERIWRPLVNPPRPVTNSFADRRPVGYGLLQRDRVFDHYQDDGVFYERRPGLWVEPRGDWGEGAVTLYEFPTAGETDDNVVAFWSPKRGLSAGSTHDLAYRLRWWSGEPRPSAIARVVDTWTGSGGRPGLPPMPGVTKLVVDFAGDALAGLDRQSGVEPVVNLANGRAVAMAAYPLAHMSGRWRLMIDVAREGAEPVDIRAYLRRGGDALSETLIYQLF